MSRFEPSAEVESDCARDLMEIISAGWRTQAVFSAAELRIADHLSGGARTSAELASATGTCETALHRLLRALTTIGICRELSDSSFELTATGRLLAADHPRSLRSWALWWGGHLWPIWGALAACVRTGKSARATLLGTQGFQHLEHDGELAETFNRVTIELTRLDAGQIVRTYDFSAFTTVMDVGGGGGELLSAILRAHPSVSGVLFELPHAIETARSNLQQAAVLERCRLVAGDFLKSIPAVAEGIILKSVLHDWADDRCRTLLSQVRSASRAGGILLVIEQELSESLSMSRSHQAIACSDLSMLVAHSGRERTLDEYRRLLQSADFEVTRVIPIGPTLRIIESRADG